MRVLVKNVIDDFQGEDAYIEVIQQQAFYLGNPTCLCSVKENKNNIF